MHRYDAMFQIMVGAWTNPERHPYYANGNALVWSQLMPYRKKEQLPDNFGIDWASGCYGGEMIVHVQVRVCVCVCGHVSLRGTRAGGGTRVSCCRLIYVFFPFLNALGRVQDL